ncbi:MAG: Dabb family protein [Treponemataceae bacterium]
MIRHVVMWKFKDFSSPAEKAEKINVFKERLLALQGIIPQIKRIEFGLQVNCANASSDAVLISDFDSFDDLQIYIDHPEHKKVSSYCKEIRTARTAVNFEV